jgi:hypothetical protein
VRLNSGEGNNLCICITRSQSLAGYAYIVRGKHPGGEGILQHVHVKRMDGYPKDVSRYPFSCILSLLRGKGH